MRILAVVVLCLSCSTSLWAQENCFENCWKNVEKSTSPFHERNLKVLNDLLGCKVPDFTVKSIKGEEFSMDKLKGKVVVINFWFTTCAPCIGELPGLNKLVEEYPLGKDVVFLAFGRDDSTTIKEFLKEHQFDYNHISSDFNLQDKYCVLGGWPMNLVIDKNCILRYIKTGGPIPGNGNDMFAYNKMKPVIEEHLKK